MKATRCWINLGRRRCVDRRSFGGRLVVPTAIVSDNCSPPRGWLLLAGGAALHNFGVHFRRQVDSFILLLVRRCRQALPARFPRLDRRGAGLRGLARRTWPLGPRALYCGHFGLKSTVLEAAAFLVLTLALPALLYSGLPLHCPGRQSIRSSSRGRRSRARPQWTGCRGA